MLQDGGQAETPEPASTSVEKKIEPFVVRPGIYIAPRGSGKSYGATLGQWIDGDQVVMERVRWPRNGETEWWKGPHSREIDAINWAAVSAYASENPDSTIMFNGRIPDWAFDLYPAILRGALIPDERIIISHLETHPAFTEAGVSLPSLIKEIEPMNRLIEENMDQLRKPVYTGPDVNALFGELPEVADGLK